MCRLFPARNVYPHEHTLVPPGLSAIAPIAPIGHLTVYDSRLIDGYLRLNVVVQDQQILLHWRQWKCDSRSM